MEQYSRWEKEILPSDLREELLEIKDNKEEIYDRFCRDLTFGTSGLRGKMGAGTNRMNSVVIRRVTMAIGDYLTEQREHPSLILSYDTRKHSREYAIIAAETLAAQGVEAWITEEPEPVPLLSYAVREMGIGGGIMITASHNPKEFNGYKVYDHCGNQIGEEKARLIEAYIRKHDYFEETRDEKGKKKRGSIHLVPGEVIERYRQSISRLALWWTEDEKQRNRAMERLSVLYTPLDGTGFSHVTEIFKRLGIKKISVVKSQMVFDGEFKTCPSPNPENRQVFDEALKSENAAGADLIIATDPDSDRMGVMVRANDKFIQLSGNETGVLLFDYLCRCLDAEVLREKVVYKSLVSTPLLDRIAAEYGIKVKNTLTGFKNIAAEMERLQSRGREKDFLFGFEESLGYLYGTYTRDKDGVMASQLICLAAAFWLTRGLTLTERLEQIYQRYGYVDARSDYFLFSAEKDRQNITAMMDCLLKGELKQVRNLPVKEDRTYAKEQVYQGEIMSREGRRHKFIIRPSGTELKLKIYAFAEGSSREEACRAAEAIIEEIKLFLIHFLRNKDGVTEYV